MPSNPIIDATDVLISSGFRLLERPDKTGRKPGPRPDLYTVRSDGSITLRNGDLDAIRQMPSYALLEDHANRRVAIAAVNKGRVGGRVRRSGTGIIRVIRALPTLDDTKRYVLRREQVGPGFVIFSYHEVDAALVGTGNQTLIPDEEPSEAGEVWVHDGE